MMYVEAISAVNVDLIKQKKGQKEVEEIENTKQSQQIAILYMRAIR